MRPAILLLALAAPLAAQFQVHVLDDDGPADFTEFQAAHNAAAPGDTILIRSGTYFPNISDLISKPLAIVADAGAEVDVSGIWQIAGLDGGDQVLLRGICLCSDGFGVQGSLEFDASSDASRVWVEDVRADHAEAGSAGSIALVRSELDSILVGPAFRTFDSDAILLDCTLSAGVTFDGFVCPKSGFALPGSRGSAGMRVAGDSEVFASTSLVEGGPGGEGAEGPPCSDGGDGGPGIEQIDPRTTIRAQDVDAVGGPGGAGGTGCADGLPGPAQEGDVTAVPGTLRRLTSNAPVREGELLSLVIEAGPGETALLFVSGVQDHEYVPSLRGAWMLGYPFFLLLQAEVPAAGRLGFSATVPELGPGVEALPVYFTLVVLTPEGAKRAGGSTASVLLDAGV